MIYIDEYVYEALIVVIVLAALFILFWFLKNNL